MSKVVLHTPCYVFRRFLYYSNVYDRIVHKSRHQLCLDNIRTRASSST